MLDCSASVTSFGGTLELALFMEGSEYVGSRALSPAAITQEDLKGESTIARRCYISFRAKLSPKRALSAVREHWYRK